MIVKQAYLCNISEFIQYNRKIKSIKIVRKVEPVFGSDLGKKIDIYS